MTESDANEPINGLRINRRRPNPVFPVFDRDVQVGRVSFDSQAPSQCAWWAHCFRNGYQSPQASKEAAVTWVLDNYATGDETSKSIGQQVLEPITPQESPRTAAVAEGTPSAKADYFYVAVAGVIAIKVTLIGALCGVSAYAILLGVKWEPGLHNVVPAAAGIFAAWKLVQHLFFKE